MMLSPGTRLGPYEIVSPLGAGGMGVVYRARDTKLGRDVALKIVSESFTYDPDRGARFEREAQLLAALNHPHIASVYGLEQADGAHCLVMELIDGETLAGRLAQGALPVAEALRIARQIADALQAAHDKGIIHRDLKPANIALTADGQVKVLDFGLAKALEGAPLADLSLSPTLSLAATQEGVILGTAAYMAPEQARGRPADKRADVWAFGCVLYEMLTGARPFAGEDAAETLAFVMAREPDWSLLPAELPAAVRTLLRACLEKDRRRRVPDIGVAAFLFDHAPALADARDASSPADADAARAQVEAAVAAVRREVRTANRRRLLSAASAAAVVTTAAAAALIWWPRLEPAVVRTEMTTGGSLALSIQGTSRDIAITPDGSRLVYRGTNQLFVRPLDRLEASALTELGLPRDPFTSPDGQWVGFFDGTALRRVAITGGPPIIVTSIDGAGARGGTWAQDGTIIYATNAGATGLQRVASSGGDVTVLTKPDRERGEADHLWPEVLPGGRAVLFTILPSSGGLANAQVAALDVTTGMQKVLIRGGHHGHYLSSGHLVYGAAGTVRAVPFDLDRLEVLGTPVPVIDGVLTTAQGGVNIVSAANGTTVYVPGSRIAGAQRSLVWVDRSGREEPLAAAPRAYQYPRIAPDGTRVALDIRDQEEDIWIWDFARQTLTRFTFDPGQDIYPLWSPDSQRIIFASSRTGVFNILRQAADGTGSVERLTDSATAQLPMTGAPDGAEIVLREDGQQHDITRLTLRRDGNTAPAAPASAAASAPLSRSTPLIQTMFAERNPEISPDGRWIAYEGTDSGREEIYVRPFPDVGAGRWQVSTAGGRTALWSRSGRELFYLDAEGVLMGVQVDATTSWRTTTPARILPNRYFAAPAGNGRSYDIAPDGKRFLMIKQGDTQGGAQNLVVVQHWTEELKRLVPVN